jgi:hypothetical protein
VQRFDQRSTYISKGIGRDRVDIAQANEDGTLIAKGNLASFAGKARTH